MCRQGLEISDFVSVSLSDYARKKNKLASSLLNVVRCQTIPAFWKKGVGEEFKLDEELLWLRSKQFKSGFLRGL